MKLHLPLSLRSSLLSCLSLFPLAAFILSPPLMAGDATVFKNETVTLSDSYPDGISASGSYIYNKKTTSTGRFYLRNTTLNNSGHLKVKGYISGGTTINSGEIDISNTQSNSYGLSLSNMYGPYSRFINERTGEVTIESEQYGILLDGFNYPGDNPEVVNNYGTMYISGKKAGINTYDGGYIANHGTMIIRSEDIGINTNDYQAAVIYNDKDALLDIRATRLGFTYGKLLNYGTVTIKTGGGADAHGILVDEDIINYGTLKTDDIVMGYREELLLMHGSTTGSSTEGTPLFVDGNEGIVILGGRESDNTIYGISGGSKLSFSSAATFSNVTLKLFDDALLTLGGDLSFTGDDTAINQYSNTLAINSGTAVRNVTFGKQFSASWDNTLILSPATAAVEEKFQDITRANMLTLTSGTLNIYGSSDNACFLPKDVTLKSGTLNVTLAEAEQLNIADTTIRWAPSGSSTPLLKLSPAATAAGITIDVGSTTLDVSGLAASGQRLLDVVSPTQLSFAGKDLGQDASPLYDSVSGLYHYHGYQTWVDKQAPDDRNFVASSGTSLVIYKNDLYYSPQTTYRQKKLDGSARTWRGGSFKVYDAEKNSYNHAASDVFVNDSKYCALATGLNMAEYWLDTYAVLNTSGRDLATPSASGSLNGSQSSNLYDIYARAWAHDNDNYRNGSTRMALGWILSGNLHGGTASESMLNFHEGAAPFAGNTWTLSTGTIDGQRSFTAKSGKIYDLHDTDGVISNASENITRIITQAFAGSDAPISIGWDGVKAGTNGEKAKHVVTCWGYETAVVGGQTIVSKLWYTDSDDKNLSTGGNRLRSFDVVYGEDQRVYLVDVENGSSTGGNPVYLTDITFMTTPAGMDEMLADYYDKSKPIYWTGTNSVWKVDNIGGKESQTRLATLSDGWRKKCEGGGRDIWAYTTFSGAREDAAFGEDVVFGESVNGVRVKEREITIGSAVKAGAVTINGEGYVWKAPKQGSAEMAMDSLVVNDGSLTLGESLTLRSPKQIVVQAGASLRNLGLIEGNVSLAAGSEFHSGLIRVTEGVDEAAGLNMALGDGLYAHVQERGLAEGSRVVFVNGATSASPYTLSTQVDFGGATITRDMYNAVEEGTLSGLVDVASLGVFGVDPLGEYVRYKFEATGYELQDRVDAFLDMFSIRRAEVTVLAGDEPGGKGLTVGSFGGSNGSSVANLQISALEGGTIHSEVELETIAGEHTRVNAVSSVESPVIRVAAGSELENDGALHGRIEVKGTLSGSGSFGETVAYEGASVVVGNSPGVASYECLTLQNGSEIVFSVDGLTPAAESLSGWGSGAQSVLTLTGQGALVLEPGAEVKIGFSADFLTCVEIGKPIVLTLVEGVEASEALLTALQDATTFHYAGLDDSLASLAENTLYSVHEFSWQVGEGETVVLNVTLHYAGQGAFNVPEPATATLSLLALTALAVRRRRR